jgi:hypothetical protein
MHDANASKNNLRTRNPRSQTIRSKIILADSIIGLLRLTLAQEVVGSSPTRPAILKGYNMFVEFTLIENREPVVINTDKISDITRNAHSSRRIKMDDGNFHNVAETLEEIKKRIGMQISPRAETIAKI